MLSSYLSICLSIYGRGQVASNFVSASPRETHEATERPPPTTPVCFFLTLLAPSCFSFLSILDTMYYFCFFDPYLLFFDPVILFFFWSVSRFWLPRMQAPRSNNGSFGTFLESCPVLLQDESLRMTLPAVHGQVVWWEGSVYYQHKNCSWVWLWKVFGALLLYIGRLVANEANCRNLATTYLKLVLAVLQCDIDQLYVLLLRTRLRTSVCLLCCILTNTANTEAYSFNGLHLQDLRRVSHWMKAYRNTVCTGLVLSSIPMLMGVSADDEGKALLKTRHP